MRKSILLLPMIVILAFLLLSGCSQKMNDKSVLASFDKQVIKTDELDKEISELPEWKQDKYKDKAGREEYLTLMAESRMILDVASKRKLEKNPEVIKQHKEFQDQIMRDELIKQEVDNKVKVSDGDIAKYYAENKAKYVEPDKVTVTEISQKDEAKAKEILEKIKAGADFTEIVKEMDAKKESQGPGSGNEGKVTLSKDSFSSAKNFVDKAFSMNIGEISDIVTQPMGPDTYYMIIRLDEKIPSRQKELSEVKDDIKGTAESEAKEARKAQFIGELRKEMKVETFADRIPATPEVKKEEGETKPEAEAKPEEKKPEEKKADNAKKAEKDVILAKIGKQMITLNEMEKNISEMQEWKKDRYKDQEGKKKYLDELIEERVLTLEAQKRKLDEVPELAKQLKEYRDQLMLKELVKEEVDNKIKVEDADIEKYYNEHKAEYMDPEKVTVTEVTFKDEAKAKEVLDKVKAGGDFTEIAKEIASKGESSGPGQNTEGKTSPFSKDSFSSAKNFVEKAFSLNKGEISDIIVQPIEPDTFYMVIRVDEHTQPRQKELSEVKDDIKWTVEREKKRQRIDQWLAEMKKASNFQIFVDRIPIPVEKKVEAKPEEKKAEAKPAEGTSATQETQKVEGQATQTTEKAVETEKKPAEKVETEK